MNKKIIKAVPAYNKSNKFVIFLLIKLLNITVVKNYITLINSIIKDFNVYIFEDKITKIANFLFYDCKLLEEVILPNTINIIGNFSFSFCTALKNITIPNSVISINDSAFCYCYSLENIIIPESIKQIGFYAFNGCENLKLFNIPKRVENIDICIFPKHLRYHFL